MDFALILVGVRDPDNYTYIQGHQNTVARLNQGSIYWNYVPVYVEYFDDIPAELASRGISKYNAAIVAHARYQNGVYTGWLRDYRRTPGLIDIFTTKPYVEQFAAELYHCGMDGNNGIIDFDHVGDFLATRNGHDYDPWQAPDFPFEGPSDLGAIILSGATFSVTNYTGALVIGDNNIITVNYGAQIMVWGSTMLSTLYPTTS